jgi:outer membrane immunogenic protein
MHQGGYRWQFGSVVFGAEVEGEANSPAIRGGTDSTKVTSVFLFTGELGYAWNAALLYLKGGGAMTNSNQQTRVPTSPGTFLLPAMPHVVERCGR